MDTANIWIRFASGATAPAGCLPAERAEFAATFADNLLEEFCERFEWSDLHKRWARKNDEYAKLTGKDAI